MSRSKRRSNAALLNKSIACAIEKLERRVLLSTFMVTNHLDSGPGSFRAAAQLADSDAGPNTVSFAVTGTITTNSQIDITGNVTIAGPGAGSLTVTAGMYNRILKVDGGANVSLSGITLANGSAEYANDGGGGAVYNMGNLSIANCAFTGNVNDGVGAGGGAIDSSGGHLSITDCTISGNQGHGLASGYGGGVYAASGNVVITGSTISNNVGVGGGIYNGGADTTLTDDAISGNAAGYGSYGAVGMSGGSGGGIYNTGALNLIDCTISGNVTGAAGLSGASNSSELSSGSGGGIFSTGSLQLTGCTVTGNSTYAGTFSRNGGHSGAGGGVFSTGLLYLTNCTVSGNGTGPADGPGGGNFGTSGGGGGIEGSPVHLTNVTITDNWTGTADTPGTGGGIGTTDALINNTIVAGNLVDSTGTNRTPGDVAGTFEPASAYNLIGSGAGATGLTAANHNLIGTQADPVNPFLSVLGNFGGPTATMPPLPISPALDAGSNALAVDENGQPLSTDQRGFPRIVDAKHTGTPTVDVGAAEAPPVTTDLVVTTSADEFDANWSSANMSLREAVALAAVLGGPRGITYAAALSGGTNTGTGPIEVSNSGGALTTQGPGSGVVPPVQIQIDADASANITGLDGMYSNAGSLLLSNSSGTITNAGSATLSNCNEVISNSGTLSLDHGSATGNTDNTGMMSLSNASLGEVFNHPMATMFLVNCGISGQVPGGLVYNLGTASMTNCTVSGDAARGNDRGSGVRNHGGVLTLVGCTISGNAVGVGLPANIADTLLGGGVFNDQNGTISMTDCTVANNTCAATDTSVTTENGGGIYNGSGTVTLMGCTITGNVCSAVGHAAFQVAGGGIANLGSMSLTNCTVSGNTASCNSDMESGASGGGISSTGTLTLVNCTISGNTASAAGSGSAGGGGVYALGGHLELSNTLIAGDVSKQPDGTSSPDDMYGAADPASAYNLVGASAAIAGLTASNHNQIGTISQSIDAKLAPLANNGGPTQTMALLAGSAAIDAGSNALAIGPDGKLLLTDQRGYYRIFNGTVDIGAYEFGSSPLLPGDADGDGKVDFADLVLVARHYGMTNATWADGDFNGDGAVGFDDLVIVARNYGKAVPLTTAAAVNAAVIRPATGAASLDPLHRLARRSKLGRTVSA